MSWVLTLSLMTTTLMQAAPAKAGDDAESLRARATKLYRAKKFAEACPLFERAVALAPGHGPTLADLGLCLQKQGKLDEARSAYLRALQVSGADATTRANVYFNLAAFHDATPAALTLKDSPTPRGRMLFHEDGPCTALPSSEPSCDKTLNACVERWSASQSLVEPRRHITEHGFNLRIHGAGVVKGAGDEADASCSSVPAPTGAGSPPGERCLYWSGDELEEGCQAEDTACEAEVQAILENSGTCKLVYVNPCEGRVGVACEGSRFKPKKLWVGEAQVTPAR